MTAARSPRASIGDGPAHPSEPATGDRAAASTAPVTDRFEDDLRWGEVIGSRTPGGHRRDGVDQEQALGVRGGALRIRPLIRPGWARAGLVHGPFARRGGLALAVHVLNGHHASEPYHLPSLHRRLARWAIGSGTHPPLLRLWRWMFRWRRGDEWRRFRQWRRHTAADPAKLDPEGNLAVGWFTCAAPGDPTQRGASFMVCPAGPRNGTLTARAGASQLPVVADFQNVPYHYVVVLREAGAAYYLASPAGARGAATHPRMRPLAIDTTDDQSPLFAGVQQSVLGEMGFSADTMVYGIGVAHLPELEAWCGSAHLADRLRGEGPLAGSLAERGGPWHCFRGGFRRAAEGTLPTAPESGALLFGDEPAGLIGMSVRVGEDAGETSLIWRAVDADNHWRLDLTDEACRLMLRVDGEDRLQEEYGGPWRTPGIAQAVQIVDDGERFSIAIDGRAVAPEMEVDRTHAGGCGVGFEASWTGADVVVHDLEAHPRQIAVPEAIRLPAAPWPSGSRALVHEDFGAAPARPDLDGLSAGDGMVWKRLIGDGVFALDPPGALRVVASVERPLRQRTAYGIAWPEPGFADLATTILPPGTARGQKQRSRAGLIFWQDDRNYIIVNTWLDDVYLGASISSFYCLNGFEDVFDAFWTNVGDRIVWGRAFELCVHFDGDRFGAMVDGEPVLQRALGEIYPGVPRLEIRHVGLVANWEWGHDTGSRFTAFTARAHPST